MILGLIRDVGSVSFDSIVVKFGFTIVVIEDLANIDGVLHLIGRAARPRFVLTWGHWILNLDVHDNDFILEK